MQIYLARNNQQAGPYSVEQLNQMLASQQVLLTDLAWHQGMSEWKALGELTQGKLVYEPAGYVSNDIHSQSNQYNNDAIQNVQVRAKAPQQELAPFHARFIAKFLDLLLWFPISYILTAYFSKADQEKFLALNQKAMDLTLSISSNPNIDPKLLENTYIEIYSMIPNIAITSALVYVVLMLSLQGFLIMKTGQSLGKKATKIKIVDYETGEKPTFLKAFVLRTLVFILPTVYFMPIFSIIDYLFSFGKKKQTLHDKLAKTKVIKQ